MVVPVAGRWIGGDGDMLWRLPIGHFPVAPISAIALRVEVWLPQRRHSWHHRELQVGFAQRQNVLRFCFAYGSREGQLSRLAVPLPNRIYFPPFSESTPDEMLSGPATTSDACEGRVRLPTPEPDGSGAPTKIRFSHVHNIISSGCDVM